MILWIVYDCLEKSIPVLRHCCHRAIILRMVDQQIYCRKRLQPIANHLIVRAYLVDYFVVIPRTEHDDVLLLLVGLVGDLVADHFG